MKTSHKTVNRTESTSSGCVEGRAYKEDEELIIRGLWTVVEGYRLFGGGCGTITLCA